MSFKSYPNGRSKSRRANHTDVSAQAEPCELRELLSAEAITVSLADAPPCDTPDAEPDSSVDDSAPEKSVDENFADLDAEVYWCCEYRYVPQPEGDFDAIEDDAPPMTFISLQPGVDHAGIIDDSFPFEQPGVDEPFVADEPVFNGEDVFPQDVIVDAPPVDGWDPSWLYRTYVTPGDDVTGVETDPDEYPVSPEDSIWIETFVDDGPGSDRPPELFVPIDEPFNDFDDDGLPDDFVMYPYVPMTEDQLGEDGLDCGVAPEGFVPGESIDSDGDGLPDDFVLYPYDPIPVDQLGEYGLDNGVSPEGFVPEKSVDFDGDGIPDDFVTDPIYSDGSFDPYIMMTFGGGVVNEKDSGIDLADGETKEVTDFDGSVIEEELYLYPVDEVVEFGDEEFLVSDGDESSVPQIRFLSASGGSEMQRTLSDSSDSAIELAIAASTPQASTTEATTSTVIPSLQSSIATNVVPVRQATSNSLFSSSRDKSTIGVALTSPSGSGTVGSPVGTKSTSTPKRAKSLLHSNSDNSDETSGLENLSPLIGDEADSPEVDAAPGPQDLQADERIAAEPTVSRNENVDSNSNMVVKNTRQAGKIRAGMIDEVMSQYSENSYNA